MKQISNFLKTIKSILLFHNRTDPAPLKTPNDKSIKNIYDRIQFACFLQNKQMKTEKNQNFITVQP